jgi:hypothetical protein
MWFGSLSCYSSILNLLRFQSTWVCYLCVQGSLPCLWSSTKVTQSLVRARNQEVLEVVYAGALCYTDLIGEAHRSDRWHLGSPVLDRSDRSSPPVWPVEHCQLKCSGRKSLIWSSRLFTPFLGDIKVLSTPVWPMEHCQLKCSGRKSLIWSSRLFTPFLGDIKVLSTLQQTHTGAALAKGRAQRAKLPFRSFPRPNRYRERIFREGSNPLRVKLFLPPIWHGFARSCSRSRAKRTPSGQIVKNCFFNYHSIFFRTLFKTASVCFYETCCYTQIIQWKLILMERICFAHSNVWT